MNIMNLFKKKLPNNIDNRTLLQKIVFYFYNDSIVNLAELLYTKSKPSNIASIPYTKEAVVSDCNAIRKCLLAENLSENEFANLAAAVFLHIPYRTVKKVVEESGYQPIDIERLTYLHTYVTTLKTLDELSSAEIKKYKISSCCDAKTCASCKKHDGKKHLVSKAAIGKTAPPFCKCCRCVIVADFGGAF